MALPRRRSSSCLVAVLRAGGLCLLARAAARVRGCAFHRARRPSSRATGQTALATVEPLRPTRACRRPGRTICAALAGECHQAAADAVPQGKTLRGRAAAQPEGRRPCSARRKPNSRARVIDAMLAEVRRQFAAGTRVDTDGVLQLIGRVLALQIAVSRGVVLAGPVLAPPGQARAGPCGA